MRAGNEGEARRVLEGAFDADRSNRVTANLLTLLDTLTRFTSLQATAAGPSGAATEAIVRLDPAEAPVLRFYAVPIVQEALVKYGERYRVAPRARRQATRSTRRPGC